MRNDKELKELEKAKQKLRHLEEHGPTSSAFTFQAPFDSNGNPLESTSD